MGLIELQNGLKSLKLVSDLKPYIVVVDDNSEYKEIVKFHLEKIDSEIKFFDNPAHAAEFVKTHQWNILAIISDFSMPQMNGFEFRTLTLNSLKQIVPFYLLSGVIDVEKALSGIEFKIFGFIEKINLEDKLISTIEKGLLERVQALNDDREMLFGFIDDAQVIVDQMESLCLDLEDPSLSYDSLQKLLGISHTLKGASSFFEPNYLHNFIHKFEDYLKYISQVPGKLNEKSISICLESIDLVKKFLFNLSVYKDENISVERLFIIFEERDELTDTNSTNEESRQADTAHQHGAKKVDSIRIEKSVLDEFMYSSGEMTVIRNMLYKVANVIEKKYSQDKDVQTLNDLLEELHKVNLGMQNKISELRKVPVASLLKPIPRLIRDVSKALDKNVAYEVFGDDLRLDNSVAEIINNSILHLLKNSLDHGLESTQDRILAGKSEVGNIKIDFKQKNEFIYFSISDDGKGINPEVIKKKLIKNNYSTSKLNEMSDHDLQMMIFDSGFSTAEVVTEISGRGVGMTAIRDMIRDIGGKLNLKSVVGIGTEFELVIPVPKSVNIKNCLFFKADEHVFGVEQDSVVYIYLHDKEKSILKNINGKNFIEFESKLVPVVSCNSLLTNNFEDEVHIKNIVLMQNQDGDYISIAVDEVYDFEDTVIKTIHSSFKKLQIYKGATFLSDGKVGLLLDVDGIFNKLELTSHKTPEESKNKLNVKIDLNLQNWFEFRLNKNESFSCLQDEVFRIEQYDYKNINMSVNGHTCIYRDQVIELIDLNKCILGQEINVEGSDNVKFIVFRKATHFVGLLFNEVVDMYDSQITETGLMHEHPFIIGHLIKANQKTVSAISLDKIYNSYIGKSSQSKTEGLPVREAA